MGIDPGKMGGIAIVGKQFAMAWKYPKDIPNSAKLIKEIVSEYGEIVLACIEKVNAFYGASSKSSFAFGQNYGGWMMALSILEIPYEMVMPRMWQKTMLDSGTGETKARSLNMARRLFPKIDLHYKNCDGMADALHIARYAKLLDERYLPRRKEKNEK